MRCVTAIFRALFIALASAVSTHSLIVGVSGRQKLAHNAEELTVGTKPVDIGPKFAGPTRPLAPIVHSPLMEVQRPSSGASPRATLA